MINEDFDATHKEFKEILTRAYKESCKKNDCKTEVQNLTDFFIDNLAAVFMNFSAVSADMKHIAHKLKLEGATDERFTPYN